MAGESARAVATAKRVTADKLLRDADLFERGAVGEEATARALAELPSLEWRIFHDVRWPGRRFANIDHVLVGPQGVFVVDSKAWTGHIDVRDGVLRQNGHRRTKAVESANDAAAAVCELLPQFDPAIVKPVLCFARVKPVFGWADDLMVCSTQNIVAMLTSRQRILDEEEVRSTAETLARSLQSATALVPHVAKVGRRSQKARNRTRDLAKTLVGAAVLAGLILLGLRFDVLERLNDLSSRSLVGMGIVAPTQPLGQRISVPGSAMRPPLDVTAKGVAVTRSKTPGMRVAHGQMLLAVELTIRNGGDLPWVSEPGTSVVLRDEATASYRTAAEFSRVEAGRVLPAEIKLKPGKQLHGFMVFEVPRRTTITQIELSVGPAQPQTVRWSVSD
ncbi:MAG: nuclease-related domain-containing protein [Marmoricola sp.]